MDNNQSNTLTLEAFEEKHVPLLNKAAELIMDCADKLDEEESLTDILSALTITSSELKASLGGRVPEIVKLKDEISKKDKAIKKLQETNQDLFLRVGSPPPAQTPEGNLEKPKMSFSEIKKMMDSL